MQTKERISAGDTPSSVSVEPRYFELSESWFEPSLDRAFQEQIIALLIRGQMPDWAVVVPPEMRLSRKLAFRIEHRIVVVAGVGLVQRDHDRVIVSEPHVEQRAPEGTIIHDSYVSQLDLKRDPLGGLSKRTLRIGLERMSSARETAGGMAIIPQVLGHGVMLNRRRSPLAFLVYAYPDGVERPSAWSAKSEGFWLGVENMARFLAALHRRLFHGYLYRPGLGFANTLWTIDGRAIPVISGWGQHAGLMNTDLAAEDVTNLLKCGFCQFHVQGLPDKQHLSIELVRRVLTAYGQMQAVFKEKEFDFQRDPVEDWQGSLDALAGDHGLVEHFIAGC